MGLFISLLWNDPKLFLIITLIVVFSICVHEYSHARVALWMGDATAADQGHLTLNPLKQMGVISIIMFLVAGIAWGAVPVNRDRAGSKYSWGPLAVALAGPCANLLLAVLAWIAFGIVGGYFVRNGQNPSAAQENLLMILIYFGSYNIVLMIFNLIPAPGLDGWNAMLCLFPKIRQTSSEALKGIMIFLIFAAMMGINFLFHFAFRIMQFAPMILGR